jgi:hypothetical protein
LAKYNECFNTAALKDINAIRHNHLVPDFASIEATKDNEKAATTL